MLRKIPLILVLMIISIFFFGSLIPIFIKEILYSVSLSIKSIITFLLPIIIFGLLFKTTASLANNATYVIGVTLVAVSCSNFFSTFLSHYIGEWVYTFDLSITTPSNVQDLISMSFVNLPQIVSNSQAMFCGIILGTVFGKYNKSIAMNLSQKFEYVISIILKLFVCIIPLFVTGFIVKLQHDDTILIIVKNYSIIFIIIAVTQFTYIAIAYYIFNNFKFVQCLQSIKNMLPAGIAGFSTMSSAASMPLTIIGTQNNVRNKDLARCIIPITVNIHLIGDCFAIPIFAYAILKNYGITEPDLISYVIFTFYFILAKFSVAAIPGGGVIVMLPILENYLNFNSEMMSLITALYILFDPVITCANVLGNGAFVQGIDKLIGSFKNKN